jgi:anaerobic magnesium-protoporphyrin IX monomethyl ester cyclase
LRISLIYPSNLTITEKYLKMMGDIPHIGLLSLGGVLQKEGHTCRLVDGFLNRQKADRTAEEAAAFKPDLFCVTSLTPNYNTAQDVARELRKRSDRPIVIGGYHATNMPDQVLQSGLFDYVVMGEGEIPLTRLVKALETNGRVDDIPGLAFRREDGSHHKVEEETIADLSVLPQRAWNLIDLKNYAPSPASYLFKPAISTMLSRGCPKACKFCSVNSMFKYQTRQHSLAFAEEELTFLKGNGIRDVNFWDSVFTHNRAWTIEICKILKKLNLRWNCVGRLDQVDFELLQFMRASGCYEIGYGVESGVQRSLDLMDKQQKLEDVERTVKLTKKAGIRCKCFFIVGFPWETRDEMEQTYAFARKLRPEIAAFSIATPYPGARWFDQFSHRFDGADYRGMHNMTALQTISQHVPAEEIQRMNDRERNRFYLHPRYAFQVLKHVRSMEECQHLFRAFWEIFVVN